MRRRRRHDGSSSRLDNVLHTFGYGRASNGVVGGASTALWGRGELWWSIARGEKSSKQRELEDAAGMLSGGSHREYANAHGHRVDAAAGQRELLELRPVEGLRA